MTRVFAAIAVLALCACGPDASGGSPPPSGGGNPPPSQPMDVHGTYSGTLTDSGACSDGSSGSQQVTRTVIVNQSGSALSLGIYSYCGYIPSALSGNSTSFGQGTCTSFVDNQGTTWTFHINASTMTFSAGQASLTLNEHDLYTTSGGQSGYCDSTTSGTLTKQ